MTSMQDIIILKYYHIGNGSIHEISNALTYFYKSSSKLIGKEIIKCIVKAAGVDVANKVISETQLDDQFKAEMRGWVDNN